MEHLLVAKNMHLCNVNTAVVLNVLDFLVKYGCNDWSSWSECTVTCGGGTRTKTRRCVFANGTYDDPQAQECSAQQCPGWSAFSAVTPCIVCGAQQGKQLHARKCLLTGVDADNECAESSFDWRDCNEQTTLGCTLMQGVTLAEVPEKTCTDIDGDVTYSLTHRRCMDELNKSVSLNACRREIVQLCSPIHAQAIGECAKPSDLADGAYHYVASDRVEYVCNHGYKVATNETDNLHVKKCINGEWIPDTVMSCEPVTCPDVKDILNGDLSVDAAYPEGPLPLHSTVIYSCNDGYEFSDGTKVLTRVCQANGHWSGQQPACEGVLCSEYTAPEHGFLLQPQPKYQHPYTIHIACDHGYARQGLSYSECLSSGLWSDANTPIQCLATTCAMFQVDLPLKVQVNSQVFGSKATFTCDTGYKLVGKAEQTCEPICQSFNFVRDHFICSTASWSGTQPVCDVLKCPAPVDIAHGTVSTLDDSPVAGEQDYQKVIRYTCNSGYHLAPGLLAVRKCQANGEWSGQLPRCDGVPCPNPLMSPNVWVSGQLHAYPNTIEMGCKRGYYAIGVTSFKCAANQVWSPALSSMRCEPVRCTPFEESGQVVVQYTGEGTAFGAQVTFSCKPGYEVANNVPRTATCTAACGDQGNQGAGDDPQPRCTQFSGVWTASPPECKGQFLNPDRLHTLGT
ncbi:sushi, von Willebrand factor type A, EGF and pentraxin domain-containing protein 1-like [Sycon ciliatum]|uniref:sushi, von Willebrand factor type A, EGF and pentraxin domain-containing protein 1-like n=1 Tax=Sycon ciliatum TaxID=27933 RepID=UPI0031F67DB2